MSKAEWSVGALALALVSATANAGPCAGDIFAANEAINKRLDELAARGKAGTQSSFATTHRQPTPATIAQAEQKVGDISESEAKAVREFMADAQRADSANDMSACEKALAEARKILGM